MKKTFTALMALVLALGFMAPAAAQLGDEEYEQQAGYGRFNDDGTYDVMIAMEMDAGDRSTAKMMVEYIADDPSFVDEFVSQPKVYTRHQMKECTVLTGKMDLGEPSMTPVTFAVCYKGASVFMVLGTDKQDMLDFTETALETGEFEMPAGYIDMTDALD